VQHSAKFSNSTLFPAQMLRVALVWGSLALVTACGSGGGGGDGQNAFSQSPAAQLGAVLPTDGDFIALAHTSISLPESSRTGSVVVSRMGDVNGISTVQYRFVSGSAGAGSDFNGVDGTLTWADGENGQRTIPFQIESDVQTEGEETFQIELFNATGAHELGINDSVTVAITDSACSASIPATMSGNTILSEPCYRLSGSATVGPSGQLDIRPGTTIVAAAGSGITFTGSSTLNAEGNPSLPVIVKGADNKPGAWNGFNLQSTSALHRINHTHIRNANNAVQLHAGGFASFNNNLLRDNSGAGVVLPMTDVDTIQTQNTFINTVRGIEILGSSIDAGQSLSLPAQTTHYVLSNGLIIAGTLELLPGTDLRMGADVPVLVLDTGVISPRVLEWDSIRVFGKRCQPI